MNKLLVVIFCFGIFAITGCFKEERLELDPNGASVGIENGGTLDLSTSKLNLVIDSDYLSYTAYISSPYTSTEDITVTVAVNDSARVAYNAEFGTNYLALPDTCYGITQTTATIPAGTRTATFNILFLKDSINPALPYMLPITIVDAQGHNVDYSIGTIYFHTDDNIFAGTYNASGIRVNYLGSASNNVVSQSIVLGDTKTPNCISQTQFYLDYADLGAAGCQYFVTIDTLTKTIVSAVPNPALALIVSDTWKVDAATYDPSTFSIHLKTEYTNPAGDARIVDEFLKRQ